MLFIVVAYLIIEPFRILITRDNSFQSSPSNITNTMLDAYELNKTQRVTTGTEDIFGSIMSRNAYLLGAAKSIQYQDVYGLGRMDPDFFERIYTIPLQSFIPRLIWSDKPMEDIGRWYSLIVWGSTAENSVAYTPIGFLYFAGGILFIVLGFFLIGILQKTLWQFYLAGGGQLLVFLALLSTVTLIASTFNSLIIYWLRYVPIYIFLQTLILKKTKKSF
jgi:hypothetical protein